MPDCHNNGILIQLKIPSRKDAHDDDEQLVVYSSKFLPKKTKYPDGHVRKPVNCTMG